MKVYLAGDMDTNWRDRVRQALGRELCVDPCDHRLDDAALYAPADLYLLRPCDVVLAYYNAPHTLPLGTSAEIGYALARQALVVVVIPDERLDDEFVKHCD
jgi:nucleoside 2-deoxyribosyltransferase